MLHRFVYVIYRLYFWNTPSTLALKSRLNRSRGAQTIHYSLNEKQLHLVTRGDIWNTIHEWNTNQKQKEELQKKEEFLWRSLLSRYGVSLRCCPIFLSCNSNCSIYLQNNSRSETGDKEESSQGEDGGGLYS